MFGTSAIGETTAMTILTRLRDRRRPGRKDYHNPALVTLLRDAPGAAVETDPGNGTVALPSEDALGPARGITLGAVIGGISWAAIAAGIWTLLQL
jgi:hypothetical protein